jgi:hypothetical protein
VGQVILQFTRPLEEDDAAKKLGISEAGLASFRKIVEFLRERGILSPAVESNHGRASAADPNDSNLVKHSGFEIARAASAYPDIEQGEKDFLKHYGAARPFTLTSVPLMFSMYAATQYVSSAGIEGDIVECGVWRGGSAMLAASMLAERKDVSRKFYLYDTYDCSWEAPAANDHLIYERTGSHPPLRDGKLVIGGAFASNTSLNDVRENMRSTGYPMEKMVLVEGMVQDTIPKSIPSKISLLRLDTDFFESTYHEMVHLYPLLQPGGVLIVDDYGKHKGATDAVDLYFRETGAKILLNRIDIQGRIAIKHG